MVQEDVAKTYTTSEAAAAAGISRATLQVWIAAGEIRAPKVQVVAGNSKRIWSEADVDRLKQKRAKIFRKKIRE